MSNPIVTKAVTFILAPDGRWDVQLWPAGIQPVDGKVYTIRIPVPAELIGEVIDVSVEPKE
jgi:hypothetical protein